MPRREFFEGKLGAKDLDDGIGDVEEDRLDKDFMKFLDGGFRGTKRENDGLLCRRGRRENNILLEKLKIDNDGIMDDLKLSAENDKAVDIDNFNSIKYFIVIVYVKISFLYMI